MKKYFKRGILLALALILVLSMSVGCGSGEGADEPSGGESQEPNGQESTEEKTLVVANRNDARTIDPHDAGDSGSVNVLNPIYETLVRYDENGEIVGVLAEEWERLDDYAYKFKLRKGVKFHNGEEMKASDVVYSFKRALSPDGAKVQYIMKAVDGDGFEIIDDYTVIIRTKEPFSPFIGYLPYIGATVVSEKEFTENPEEAPMNPVGTGPFKFVEWNKNDRVKYVRNEDYWGELPKYEKLEIRTIAEDNSRVIELETGGVDIALFINPNDIARIEDNPDTRIERQDSTVFTYYGFNTSKAPFDNPEVRRAFDYAIDEQSIVDTVYRGISQYTPGPVTPNQMYYDDSDTKAKYDPELAKKILEEQGIEEGAEFDIYIRENNEERDAATVIQSQLMEVGIKLNINALESGTFYEACMDGETELFISGWGAVGFPEPDNNIYGPIHSEQIPFNNYTFYSNPELDELLNASRFTPNGPEREKIVKDIQKLLRREVPYVTFSNTQQVVGVRKEVEGFVPTPASAHYYDKAYFVE